MSSINIILSFKHYYTNKNILWTYLAMPFTYNGRVLTKFGDKKGGKNPNGGFYYSVDDHNKTDYFFVKDPEDTNELVLELLAGLYLHKLIDFGVINEEEARSFVCVEGVGSDENGRYVLIQPMVPQHPLYKRIGTGYRNGSDRNPLKETFFGPAYYEKLALQEHCYGLTFAMALCLSINAQSAHSGNMNLNNDGQFSRLDWGDAFRHFFHPANKDILFPYEYQGSFNFKRWTKGYFANYGNLLELFPEVAAKAKVLLAKLEEVSQSQGKTKEALMTEIFSQAFKEMPADLIKADAKEKLANYLYLPSFAKASFGENGNCQEVAAAFANKILERLAKIAALDEPYCSHKTKAKHRSKYRSIRPEEVKRVKLLDEELDSKLQAAIKADSILSTAVGDKRLSIGQKQDLLILKKFHDDKIALNTANHFGSEYNEAIKRFYKLTLEIRLSDKKPHEQIQSMIASARKEFHPRHKTERLTVDVMMMIGCLLGGLGLIIGLGRLAMGKTFFFSNTETDRTKEFTQFWLRQINESEEGCLLKAPAASA